MSRRRHSPSTAGGRTSGSPASALHRHDPEQRERGAKPPSIVRSPCRAAAWAPRRGPRRSPRPEADPADRADLRTPARPTRGPPCGPVEGARRVAVRHRHPMEAVTRAVLVADRVPRLLHAPPASQAAVPGGNPRGRGSPSGSFARRSGYRSGRPGARALRSPRRGGPSAASTSAFPIIVLPPIVHRIVAIGPPCVFARLAIAFDRPTSGGLVSGPCSRRVARGRPRDLRARARQGRRREVRARSRPALRPAPTRPARIAWAARAADRLRARSPRRTSGARSRDRSRAGPRSSPPSRARHRAGQHPPTSCRCLRRRARWTSSGQWAVCWRFMTFGGFACLSSYRDEMVQRGEVQATSTGSPSTSSTSAVAPAGGVPREQRSVAAVIPRHGASHRARWARDARALVASQRSPGGEAREAFAIARWASRQEGVL